jgi:hypothetical protein
MHYDGGKHQTRILEQNIHNLVYGRFEITNEYGFPNMYPVHIDNLQDIPLQGFNYALKEQHPENIGVHFFLHDYQFERVWKYPDRYTECLSKFAFVLSPDFSPYADTPKAIKVFNIYRKMWCGRYWQEHGIKVIPTITWGNDEDLEWCLEGVPKHSTIAISTMGEGRWANFNSLKSNWHRILDRLEPETILLYGKDLSNELEGNILFKRLINSKVAM